MSDTTKIIFYDLSSQKDPESWSPNTIKIRDLLNYLDLKYDLKFIGYPDILATLGGQLGIDSWEKQGVSSPASYTLPLATFILKDKEESVMGGEYQIIDKLCEYFGKDVHDKIYQGQEELMKVFSKYRTFLSLFVWPTNAPFVYNILESDRSKEFYISTRLKRGLIVLEAQKEPTDKLRSGYQTFHLEVSEFKSFLKIARDSGATEEKVSLYEQVLSNFKSGKSKYLLGDNPSFADFQIYGLIIWCLKLIEGGAPEFDFLQDKIWKEWFDRLSVYHH